ncbi:FtsW/RodA/SpoVE family cell cycle protein [uncultured Desulfobulbus sp.]|uniref:FtsW/RodA/SpoVE family cell cycle protein n=1 Tax=uncultured Desulfobulbus sp. TaxID=239745 RepID=UPI0029C6E18A|nr:FtsW/RodA/SpoVE family cell cycle protein [uncultured Desulfobulbus sp.]
MQRPYRIIEGKLLIFASFLIISGFALVFLAKLQGIVTSGSININTASANSIAAALKIDENLAKRIIDYRNQNGFFENTSAISDVRLLKPVQCEKLVLLKINKLTPRKISNQTGIDLPSVNRVLDVISGNSSSKLDAKHLAKIPIISDNVLSKAEPHIRVRDPITVILSFWIYAVLVMAGFLLFHTVLRRRAPQADFYILPCVMMLAGLGMIALFSIKDPLRDSDVYSRQAQGILLGLIAASIPLAAWHRNLRLWRYTYVYVLFAVFTTLMLAVFGSGPGGAKLRLFGLQPVEIVKIALAYFVASYLADRWMLLTDKSAPAKGRFQIPLFHDIAPLLVMYILSIATFILVKDLGPMLLLFGMFAAMLYTSTGKSAFISIGIVIVAVTGLVAYFLHLGVFDVRVDMWLNPWHNSHPNGMQLGQALWGMGSGGIWGSGLGLGQPSLMPRSGSDLVFAALGEELGLVGSLFIAALFAVLIARSFRIAMHARTDFERLLITGISVLLGLQTVIILFGVLGIIPLTGVTLPFVSYGKTSIIASFFMMGLLLNASSSGKKDISGVRIETHKAINHLSTAMLILLLGIAGIGRLVWMQGVKADQTAGMLISTPDADGYVRPHVNPRLKLIEASIPRGTIYDRNGEPLAVSRLSELQKLNLVLQAQDRPGGRYYPYGADMAHIVGYMDQRCGGPAGMEMWRNNELRGFDDYSELLPLYRYTHTPFRPKIEGKDVRLTIDAKLQQAVRESLEKYAGKVTDKRTGKSKHKGAAVVIDVYTGEVLAAVSIPEFNPNELTQNLWKRYNKDKSDEAVLFDRSINGLYPPGSTFKLATASAALENNEDFLYRCNHKETDISWRAYGKTYSRRQITDLEEMTPHGVTDLAKAIRVSCNIYFAHLGMKLGQDKLHDIMLKYGFSQTPSSQALAEDLPDNSYGQGIIQVTPLEMARMTAAIANGGIMMKPHFVKEISINGTTTELIKPIELGRPISSKSAASLRKMMADVTRIGTGKGLFSGLNVDAAGKTGSAENDRADKMPHSWFVGFAPVKDPRIAFAVVVENGGYGRAAAGPICRDIVKSALK